MSALRGEDGHGRSGVRFLLLALLLIGSSAFADRMVKDAKTITNVISTFYFYDSLQEMYEAVDDIEETKHDYVAISFCERNEERNIAWCDIYTTEPMNIDGERTLTLGHEVLHGVWGGYHPDPRVKRCIHCVGKH